MSLCALEPRRQRSRIGPAERRPVLGVPGGRSDAVAIREKDPRKIIHHVCHSELSSPALQTRKLSLIVGRIVAKREIELEVRRHFAVGPTREAVGGELVRCRDAALYCDDQRFY